MGFLTRLILASFSDHFFGFLNLSLTTDTILLKKINTLKNVSHLFPEVEGKLTFKMPISMRVTREILYYLFIPRYLSIFTFGYEQFRVTYVYANLRKRKYMHS